MARRPSFLGCSLTPQPNVVDGITARSLAGYAEREAPVWVIIVVTLNIDGPRPIGGGSALFRIERKLQKCKQTIQKLFHQVAALACANVEP